MAQGVLARARDAWQLTFGTFLVLPDQKNRPRRHMLTSPHISQQRHGPPRRHPPAARSKPPVFLRHNVFSDPELASLPAMNCHNATRAAPCTRAWCGIPVPRQKPFIQLPFLLAFLFCVFCLFSQSDCLQQVSVAGRKEWR